MGAAGGGGGRFARDFERWARPARGRWVERKKERRAFGERENMGERDTEQVVEVLRTPTSTR